jgi:hypothetical protein
MKKQPNPSFESDAAKGGADQNLRPVADGGNRFAASKKDPSDSCAFSFFTTFGTAPRAESGLQSRQGRPRQGILSTATS